MRRRKAFRIFILFATIISFVLGLGTKLIGKEIQVAELEKLGKVFFVSAIVWITFLIIEVLLSNRIYKGLKYFWNYITVYSQLEQQMLDAGFGIMRGNYIELPKFKIEFDKDLSAGRLTIRNKIKFDSKLDNMAFTPALGRFIVERHYQTADGNNYVFELLDGASSFKLVFHSFKEFQAYNDKIPAYELFLDARTRVKLQHTLIVGQTGAGKSYSTFSLILQMLNKHVKYNIYYADPKGSSLAVIGSMIAPSKTGVTMQEIIDLLEEFVRKMEQRQTEMKKLLRNKIDGDYADFGLNPSVFLFEEYASFNQVLATQEKRVRDKVKSLIYQIILMGRQSGFFFFAILQKSDATIIDTAIRDNLPLKIVLGNAEKQTYVTAYGASSNIPNRYYSVGEGVFTEPSLAPEPKFVQFPYYKFDILKACTASPRGVTTGAPEIKD